MYLCRVSRIWVVNVVTTKYAANCRNRNMTQENVCFADSLKLLTPIIVSTHSLPISSKKQKKSIDEKSKWMKQEIMSQRSSLNPSIAISLFVSICLWWLTPDPPPPGCQVKVPCLQCQCHRNDVSVIIIMSVSPICPNNVTITCLCCDGFSEIYFLCLLLILPPCCGHSPNSGPVWLMTSLTSALANIRGEKKVRTQHSRIL